jgi:hypothetical protein
MTAQGFARSWMPGLTPLAGTAFDLQRRCFRQSCQNGSDVLSFGGMRRCIPKCSHFINQPGG